MDKELKDILIGEIEKLHNKNLKASTISADYFEPGEMEYLDKYDGTYDDAGNICIRFESKGTRYDGRTEQIEQVKNGDEILIIRDKDNQYNSNNFTMTTKKYHNVGNMPAELCNAIAPLYDSGELKIVSASASYVEPISSRNRYAKQAVLFVEMKALCKW